MNPNKKDKRRKNKVYEDIPKPASSLGLEIMVLIHKIYLIIYNIILFLLFIFKKFVFPNYPDEDIYRDVILSIFFIFVNIIRLRLTSIGNKAEKAIILLVAVICGIVNLIGYFYFIYLQKYCTYYDLVFGVIGLVIVIIEIIFSVVAIFYIKVHEKNM